ncbi:VWA domain-containing protein [Sinorhizobium meliloti]|nr:VWA domain-containing protein [Sinorhizobium meliloti]MDW9976523.1 VWA domain-containing protein [Sinorhizobium meliloti]MDX0293245.1 VWA domain-containing protein [Sinorhizobium meliloti]
MQRVVAFLLVAILFLDVPIVLANEPAESLQTDTIVVFDSSGSMAGRAGGSQKFRSATRALRSLLQKASKTERIGLFVLGGSSRDQCSSTERPIATQRLTPSELTRRVAKLRPIGDTPLAKGLEQLRNTVPRDVPLQIIILTDGTDSCSGDVCKVSRSISETTPLVRIHVVGFLEPGVDSAHALRCIADASGGRYIEASDEATIASLIGQLEPFEALLRCSIDLEYRQYGNCRFTLSQDPSARSFVVGTAGTLAKGPSHVLDVESFPTPALTTRQIDFVLRAISLYGNLTAQQLITRALVCGLGDERAPDDVHLVSISLTAAHLQTSCSGEEPVSFWLKASAKFLDTIRERGCDEVQAIQLTAKDQFIDAALRSYVYSDGIRSTLQAELMKQLLLFDMWSRVCAFHSYGASSSSLPNSPAAGLYLRRERLYSAGDTAGPITFSSERPGSLARVYDDWNGGLMATGSDIQRFCDDYDPAWRKRREVNELLDLASTDPGCIVFAPKKGRGQLVNTTGNDYSGYGSIIFLDGQVFTFSGKEIGSPLFVSVHSVDDKSLFDLLSFPAFFGVAKGKSPSPESVYSFHFVPNTDVAMASRKIVTPDLSPEIERALIADGDGLAIELRNLLAPDHSQIDADRIEQQLQLSISGLLGTPWRHLATGADVCAALDEARNNRSQLFSLYNWDAVLSPDDTADKRAFCGEDTNTQCLARVLGMLTCLGGDAKSAPIGGAELNLDVRKRLLDAKFPQ